MEEIVICHVCSFKCSKSQLYKTGGFCPRLRWKDIDHQVKVSKKINVDVGSPTVRPPVSEK